MAAKVNFKVYLKDEDNKVLEIRRFISDEQATTSFQYLHDKLESVFPALREKNFSVSWKDDDHEVITISSNEELRISGFTPRYDVNKLYVVLQSEAKKNKEDRDQGLLHPSVICDGCDGIVRGFRYKCLICDDYDLCSECEALHIHPEHFMIRLAQPIEWSPHLKNHLIRDIKKFILKRKREDKGDHCNKSKSRRHHSGYSNECPFSTFTNLWSDIPAECPMKKTTEKKEPRNPLEAFNIPMYIPEILKAFGLDIGIEVESDNKQSTSQSDPAPKTASQGTSPMAENTTKKFPGEGKILIEKNNQNDEAATMSGEGKVLIEKNNHNDEAATMSDSASTASQESSVAKNAVVDDWTMVDKSEGANISRGSSASGIHETFSSLSIHHNVAAEAAEKPSTVPSAPEPPSARKMYPELKESSETVPHPDPQIQEALETLISMGFNNKNGLLAYFLQKEDCNINKVLDLLQGVHL